VGSRHDDFEQRGAGALGATFSRTFAEGLGSLSERLMGFAGAAAVATDDWLVDVVEALESK
jgi:hypothetical protein